ncbi:PIG-L family deacetylase [Luteimonas sp. BDR2-5]|uniref:PIG-L deacetylase family protein n=1 Tax=Proluteimonas luteida TaxID=2878685 RepID=UPI001E32597F|nr:PIG-L family deacetylase [Luteimonas sp. BDR2-5]MCD9028130.1 PIG-L family deacetylase [Luteimonas sp. BDR2-5]
MATVAAVDIAMSPRIEGAGTPESAWRRSPWLAALPMLDAGAWLAGIRRLVVVAPHPDDEALGAGGLIATARAAGLDVRVVSVTDGEACYPGVDAWPAARLRAARRRELARAMACLGVCAGAITSLDLGDGHVAAQERVLSDALRPLLRSGDRVLTTWRGDGHPDHEACARGVERAAAACAADVVQFPVWAWHWMSPDVAVAPLPEAFRCRLPAAACSAKAKALACFASQLRSDDPAVPPILPPHVLARFGRGFEVLLR